MIDAETQPWFGPIRRLSKRGVNCRGLAVDLDGVTLGPDLPLVRRTSKGYLVADADEISLLIDVAFGGRGITKALTNHLASIARALNSGDLAKAQILGLYFPIGELTERQLDRFRRARVSKSNFNPEEPRDERGRWTSGPPGTVTPADTHSDVATGRINDLSGEDRSTAAKSHGTPSLDEAAKGRARLPWPGRRADQAENHEYYWFDVPG